MLLMDETCLRDAGCKDTFIERFQASAETGDTNSCLQLLRLHRSELLCALHEAQRPIDVCDLIIHDLETSSKA